MLTSASPSRLHGFTLVEVMFAIVVLAILATLAMPSLRTMIRNAEIRNATEAVLNGLQKARAEAVARNTNVAFTLATNSGWIVYVVNPQATIEDRFATEGSSHVKITMAPALANTITYNNLGQIAANSNGSATLARVDAWSDIAGTRALAVIIGISGNAKMCDPNLPATDARAC